jgi:hypothetical protein
VVEDFRNLLEYGGGTVGWSHQFWGSGFGSCGFDTRGCFLFRLPSGRLGAEGHLVSGFLGPAAFLVAVNLCCLGKPVTGCGGGLGVEGAEEVALTTRPPRTTWFHPSPRSLCSAEGPAGCAFGAADWSGTALLCGRWGNCLASAARASFHLTQPW